MITDAGRTLFTEDELRCKGSGQLRLAPGFAEALRKLRIAFAHPMIVTSCCRSAKHNANVGGHPRSLHVCDLPHWDTEGTAAIDIRATDGGYRAVLTEQALAMGWAVGVHARFLHLDRRIDYTPLRQSLFLY